MFGHTICAKFRSFMLYAFAYADMFFLLLLILETIRADNDEENGQNTAHTKNSSFVDESLRGWGLGG